MKLKTHSLSQQLFPCLPESQGKLQVSLDKCIFSKILIRNLHHIRDFLLGPHPSGKIVI